MIFGSSDKFAIYYDVVKQWSNNGFNEGFISIFINKDIIPINYYDYVSTLNVNIDELNASNLNNPKANNILFEKDKLELCQHLLKARYPASAFYSNKEYDDYPDYLYEEEDFSYFINLDFLIKAGYLAFVLSNNNMSRIIIMKSLRGADFINLSELKDEDIYQIYIETDELLGVIKESIFYYKNNIENLYCRNSG